MEPKLENTELATWTPKMSELEVLSVVSSDRKFARGDVAIEQATPNRLALLRPHLEWYLAIHLARHPAEAGRVDADSLENPLVADLVGLLTEFPALARACRIYELAGAVRGSRELIEFATWIYLTPDCIRGAIPPLATVINSLDYLSRSDEGHGGRSVCSPRSWLQAVS